MAQKRVQAPKSSSTAEKGEFGEAYLIKVNGTKARVKFLATENEYLINVVQGNYDEDGVTLPNHVPFLSIDPKSPLKVSATMTKESDPKSPDKNRVLYCSPWSGTLSRAKFRGFKTAGENQPPIAETKVGKGNKPYTICTPIIEIVGGDWKGLQYRNNNLLLGNSKGLFFLPDENGMLGISSFEQAQQLVNFGDCVGGSYFFESIPFSENPLPEIQEKALELDREFDIQIVKGWIEEYIPPFNIDPDEYIEEETSVEETNPILED